MMTNRENMAPAHAGEEQKQEPQPVDSQPTPRPEAEEAPLAESEKSARKQEYWRRVLTGNPDTVPADVCERAGADRPDLSREQQLYTLCSAVNRSWVADHKGVPREELLTDWKKYRAELATELDAAENEQEVFVALSAREAEAPRLELARRVYEKAYLAAMNGEPEWHPGADELAGLSAQDKAAAAMVVRHAREEGLRERERLLPVAQQLADGMDVFAAVEEDAFSAPRVFAGAPGLLQAVEHLAGMDADERQRVAYLARRLEAEARRERGDEAPEEEGLVSRSVRAMRRGASTLGYGVLQAINNAGIATLHNAGESLGGDWGQSMKEGAATWDRRMRVLEEIRQLTQQEVVPLLPEGASRAERYFLDGVQSVPTAVVACCGGAGFGALALSGMGASVAEARRRAPETPQQLQMAAGVVAGVVQGGIYLALGRLGGRMLEQSVSRFMKARGSGLGNYSLAGLKTALSFSAEGVKMMLGGKAAAAAELGVHELAARASSTASHIDWKQFGDNLTDIEHNMREAATLLPFLLIGAGHVALRHFRSADTVLGSGKRLLDWKVDEKKVNEILRQENVDVKNELLKASLRESELWRNERLFCMIFPSMKLLNLEGKQVFRKAADVCDFLQLPASFAAGKAGRMAPAAAERARTGRALREEWEQQAGMWDGPGNLEQLSIGHGSGQRVLMNGRGRYSGHYYFRYDHPLHSGKLRAFLPTEAREMALARRQEVTARFDELRALSARLLLQLYSDDVCTAANGCDTDVLRAEAEQTQRRYLELAADCVSARARGKSEKEVFDAFARDCGELLSRYREGREVQCTGWLQSVPQEFLDKIERYCLNLDNKRMYPHPELREFFWLMYRTRVCAAVLSDLLPSTEDFQTLLTTQHSPAEAYRHLLARELTGQQNNADAVPGAVSAPANARRVALYSRLTGVKTEKTRDDKGRTLYRMRRPDGRMTPWHNTPQAMVNDVAGNAAFAFMPLGTPLDEWLKRRFDDSACLSTLPAAGEHDYSGHDRLCAAALQDLSRLWLEDASHLQPGMLRESRYRAERVLREGRNGQPVLELAEPGRFALESKSSLTPYSLALGRFVVYWTHRITGGSLSPERAADFLVNEGIISPEQRQQILDMGKAPLMPRRKNVPLKETPPADIDGRNRKLGEGLGLFTLRYFFARLPELPVPASMKHWYAQTAFSPDYRRLDGPPLKGRSLDIHKTHNQHSLLGWVNHQAVHQLRDLAPYIRQYRKRYARGLPDARIAELMPGAYSADRELQAEQAWAHRLYGQGVFYYAKPQHWAMLHYPASAWQQASPEEQARLYHYLKNGPGNEAAAPPEVPEGVPPELVNLETVLHKYPMLHYYSYEDALSARTLNVLEPRVAALDEGDKEGDYKVSTRIRADYEDEVVPMPAFISTNEDVLQALHTLDRLRRYPRKDKPYFDGERIWWKGKRYGQQGMQPAGLERWSAYEPMQTLIHNLWRVRLDATTGGEEDTVDVNGVEMPILAMEELNPPSLKGITMYRLHDTGRRLYRLMPGMSSGVDDVSRNPYVVGLYDGVYVGTEDFFSGLDEFRVQKVPLEDFRRYTYFLPFDPEMSYLTLRRRQVRYFLEQVFTLADDVSAGKRGQGAARGELTELLLRLYEDTCFTGRLEGRYPFDLETGEARAVALAGNIFACLSAPLQNRHYETREAFLYLKQEAERLRSNKEHLYELVEALVTGNNASDETRESLKSYLDADDEPTPETLVPEVVEKPKELSFSEKVALEFGIPLMSREEVNELAELAGKRAEEEARKKADPEYMRRLEESREKLRQHRKRISSWGY